MRVISRWLFRMFLIVFLIVPHWSIAAEQPQTKEQEVNTAFLKYGWNKLTFASDGYAKKCGSFQECDEPIAMVKDAFVKWKPGFVNIASSGCKIIDETIEKILSDTSISKSKFGLNYNYFDDRKSLFWKIKSYLVKGKKAPEVSINLIQSHLLKGKLCPETWTCWGGDVRGL